ncbi:hypothetical protein MENTO_v1c05680 [Mesoplasma entomophilum]|uniref:Uncharacterized protein n=1 Tax=Mesoplasma entomophilum TaxID=2149 RepID=A0A3S5Y0I4_9MOLU|nr:hypothetical protein [Mesoplasma entomophilum]ATQ35700.1 hypothetical protein CS528_02980 [Mesoplasma entomophilum]ATZ19670.1 hypothetical protein MENTO_v1c05680 [Mesoplasma entomophilum]
MNRKIKLGFLLFFALTPFFCIMLDIIMTIIQPSEINIAVNQNLFDITIASETIYFSIWTSILTIVWATCSIINYYRKPSNKIKWSESEHVLTMIVAYQLLVMLVYTGTIIFANDKIEGMDTWYNILKSILEHWLVPIVIIGFYFYIPRKEKLDAKNYVKNIGWKNCILPIIYIIYITLRAGLIKYYIIHNNVPEETIYQIFPYKGGNPFVDKVYIWLPGYLVTATSGLILGTLFNFLSIKTTNKIWK